MIVGLTSQKTQNIESPFVRQTDVQKNTSRKQRKTVEHRIKIIIHPLSLMSTHSDSSMVPKQKEENRFFQFNFVQITHNVYNNTTTISRIPIKREGVWTLWIILEKALSCRVVSYHNLRHLIHDLVQSLWKSHRTKRVSSEIVRVQSRSQIKSQVVVT